MTDTNILCRGANPVILARAVLSPGMQGQSHEELRDYAEQLAHIGNCDECGILYSLAIRDGSYFGSEFVDGHAGPNQIFLRSLDR